MVLQQIGDSAVSTYINANWVRGPKPDDSRRYIASMGPKDTTADAHWRMVWENEIVAMVMTTNTFEAGKNKCEVYCTATFGIFYIWTHDFVRFRQRRRHSATVPSVPSPQCHHAVATVPLPQCHHAARRFVLIGVLSAVPDQFNKNKNLQGPRNPARTT